MKYLKLFESYSDKRYNRISPEIGERITRPSNLLDFTESDINKIKSHIQKFIEISFKEIIKYIEISCQKTYPKYLILEIQSTKLSRKDKYSKVRLTKKVEYVFRLHRMNDSYEGGEWYIVEMLPTNAVSFNPIIYFKCDQFDGMIECITDNMELYQPKKILKENISNKDYYSITYKDFCRIKKSAEAFSETEISNIHDLCPDHDIRTVEDHYLMSSTYPEEDIDIRFLKFTDEWFLFIIGKTLTSSSFYMCDQFEGLSECVEDNLNKPAQSISESIKHPFQEINDTELDELLSKEVDIFTNSEIHSISNKLGISTLDYNFHQMKNGVSHKCKTGDDGIFKNKNVIVLNDPTGIFLIRYIVKLPDEWYIVTTNASYKKLKEFKRYIYKCDQFDGLISCLNHCYKNISEV